MMRNLTHMLLCVILCMTLAASGAKAAAARLAMAVEMTNTTELVICAEGYAKTILVNVAGEPITPTSHDCSDCPDCRQLPPMVILINPLATPVVPPVSVAVASLLPNFVLGRAAGPTQARAPPKEM